MSRPIKVTISKKHSNGDRRTVGDAANTIKARYAPMDKVVYDTEDANSYRFLIYRHKR